MVRCIVRKISSLKIVLVAFAFGLLFSCLLGYISYACVPEKTFTEITSLPPREETNKFDNEVIYKGLTDIYDFTSQSVGIDVSTWQGVIDYEEVKRQGVEFVMIRVGLRNADNKINEDEYFERNITRALAAGLHVGVYFYSTASNEIEALEEAKWVVERIKDYKITYPVVYDLENIGLFNTAGLSLEQVNKHAKMFLDYVKNSGYVGCLYSNGYDLRNRWDTNYLKDYLVWYAHYTDEPSYEGNYVIWQYSNTGKVKGIYGNVDLDVAYFSYIGD